MPFVRRVGHDAVFLVGSDEHVGPGGLERVLDEHVAAGYEVPVPELADAVPHGVHGRARTAAVAGRQDDGGRHGPRPLSLSTAPATTNERLVFAVVVVVVTPAPPPVQCSPTADSVPRMSIVVVLLLARLEQRQPLRAAAAAAAAIARLRRVVLGDLVRPDVVHVFSAVDRRRVSFLLLSFVAAAPLRSRRRVRPLGPSLGAVQSVLLPPAPQPLEERRRRQQRADASVALLLSNSFPLFSSSDELGIGPVAGDSHCIVPLV